MLEVYSYNAGKGDCIRLRFANTHNIFVDSGVIRFASQFRLLCDNIKQSGESLDALVLTHVDDDHIGGFLGNIRRTNYLCPFDEVWMNHSGNATASDRVLSVRQNDEIYARLIKQGVCVIGMHTGDRRIVADAVIETFSPSMTITAKEQNRQYREVQLAWHRDYRIPLAELARKSLPPGDTSLNNRQSIVFSFEFENHKLLFTGDAWAEDVALAKGNYDLVKLPHHGSARNISEEFGRSIKSSNFLICTDGVHHPDKQTIAKLEEWYGEINIISTAVWWKNGYFLEDDRSHNINYYWKEGILAKW